MRKIMILERDKPLLARRHGVSVGRIEAELQDFFEEYELLSKLSESQGKDRADSLCRSGHEAKAKIVLQVLRLREAGLRDIDTVRIFLETRLPVKSNPS